MSKTSDWVGAFLQQARSDWQAHQLMHQSPSEKVRTAIWLRNGGVKF